MKEKFNSKQYVHEKRLPIKNYIHLMKLLFLCVFVISVEGVYSQQKKQISGRVIDITGETIIGANIIEVGTTNGTITDIDGKFFLTVEDNAEIYITYIGYLEQKINTRGKETFEIILEEDIKTLEEVVVTAFSTQKRINVTGAITTVSGKDILAAPVSNISNALVGVAPGITAVQAGGEPGRNEADITIRGVATYSGSSSPLIVIDGIEQTTEQAFTAFNSLDPNEILGISVLKDASSTAVYGIRAANGVIIVTTKRGTTGKPKVSFSSNFGITKATSLQKGLSSYEWALFRNEAINNEIDGFGDQNLARFLYSEDDLWKFRHNRDFTPEEVDAMTNLTSIQKEQLKNSPALYYGSNDMYSQQFGDLGPQWQINVKISGGTEKVKYFTSLGRYSQESISNPVKYYGANTGSKFSRYNFRANIDVEVFKNTTFSVNSAGQFGTTQGPAGSVDPYNLYQRYVTIMQLIYDGTPFSAPGIIDNHLISAFNIPEGSVQQDLASKTGSQTGAANAVYNLLTSGSGYLYNTLLDNTFKIKHEMSYLANGLTLQASLNYQDDYNRYVTIVPSIPTYTVRRGIENPNELEFFGGNIGGDTFTSRGYSNWNKLYIDAGLTYNTTFKGNNIGLLFLGKASKYTMPNDNYNTPSGIMGLVGRFTYDYNDRYMAEFNMGYNGTEQFSEGNRFGFFPAFSAGWVPTNEPFFPENKWVTFFKLRGSYGEVGNDQLGSSRYLYLPNTYNLNQSGYYFGNSDGSVPNAYYSGVTEGSLGNPNITWEKAKKYDIGIETRFLNNKLSFTYDWFIEDRSNILTRLGIIPASYGVAQNQVPPANVGKTTNKGYDIILAWSDKTNEIGYNIEGFLSYARNKIIYRAEVSKQYEWMAETGHMIGQTFGLKSDGFYNTMEELNSRPYNTFTSNRTTLGDIKYVDLNGDGMIDNKDIAPIGYPNRALYQFGLKLGFNYKGVDLRMLFNGTAQGSLLISRISIPFYKQAGNAFKWQYDGRWTPEKYAAGEKITYPRATFNSDINGHNFMTSDFWMLSNDFFKLKNLEIGYTFPASMNFMQAFNMSSIRIYATGYNLYTIFDKMGDIGIDPETKASSGYAYVYPITTTITFGVNIQF